MPSTRRGYEQKKDKDYYKTFCTPPDSDERTLEVTEFIDAYGEVEIKFSVKVDAPGAMARKGGSVTLTGSLAKQVIEAENLVLGAEVPMNVLQTLIN